MKDIKPYSLPITVGVTGHRQIAPAEIGSVQQAVTGVLADLRRRWPSTPVLLLSGLAEGADRLVARIAIEQFGAELVAVLPMAIDEFRKDFATAESKAEFDALLSKSRQVVIPFEARRELADERRTGYRAVGEWIALHSHLLIALWDGDRARGRGGTAEIVDAKLEGRYSTVALDGLLAYDEGGAIAHVHTVRPGQAVAGPTDRVRWLYPESTLIGATSGKHRFDFVIDNIEHLNRHLVRAGRTEEGWVSIQQGLKATNMEALKSATSHFASAFQRHTHASVFYMACATTLVALASPFEGGKWSTIATALSIFALVSGFFVWAFSHWRQWQRLHTDYRAIAEGCRVQSVWLACGLRHCVADHYHPVQAASVRWIRRVLRTAWLLDGLAKPSQPTPMPQSAGFEAGRRWIVNQKEYFVARQGGYDWRARHFAILSVSCLALGLLIWVGGSLLDLFFGITLGDLRGRALLDVGKIILAAGASLHAYHVFMAFGDLRRSYAISARLFSVAADELEQLATKDDKAGIRRLIFELGAAALAENASWVLTQRQRHLMPPVG